MFPHAFARMPQVLSRSSSAASVSSIATISSMDDDVSMSGLSTTYYPIVSIEHGEPQRRTRKRFSSTQLMMLEHLYHQTSHPTREQREILSREANIELRSVTVWFQNKRQTERKVALSGGAASSTSALHLTTIDAREHSASNGQATDKAVRSRRMSGTSQARSSHVSAVPSSPTHSSSGSSTRTVRTHSQSHAHHRHHPKPAPNTQGRPTLDHVASRAERTHLRTPTRSSRSLPNLELPNQTQALPPAPTMTRHDSLSALWAHLPSSPLTPSESPSPCDRDRELLDFSRTTGRKHLTLEYACAAARVLGQREDAEDDGELDALPQLAMEVDEDRDEEDSERMLVTDTGGDTEDDGEHEAITPQSSQGSIGPRRTRTRANLWDEKTVPTTQGILVQGRDADVMNAAIALCGLAGLQ